MSLTLDTTHDTVFDRRESAARSYCRWFTPVLASARGSLVRDTDGNSYLDFLAGAGSLNYGHNDPDLKAALLDYIAADGIAHSLDLFTEAKAAFLRAFESRILLPRDLDYQLQFTGPTGANAVEAAVKLARKVTGRNNIIAFTHAFHGVSAGALAATASSFFRGGPVHGLHGVTRMPYDGYLGEELDTAELLARMLEDPSGGIDAPAAILLETVQGEGGLDMASAAWMRQVARVAREVGALLIVDDIQAGCGRTGTFFSFEPLGVTPDLVVLSKSLSGLGLPMSLVLVRPELDQWLPAEHNGTFRGNNHAFVTATAALEKFWADDRLAQDVLRRSEIVTARLLKMAEYLPGSRLKGRGMLQGLSLGDPAVTLAVRAACVRNGLLIESAGARDEVIKILAPLTTDDDLLEWGLDVLDKAIAAASSRALAG